MKNDEINDVATFLFNKKITSHIDTKDGGFFNGLIIELHKNFIVLRDRFHGNMPISFSEIKVIEKFRGGNNGGKKERMD